MLKAQTTHDLVVTIVPGHVVTQIPNCVVNGVVPGKELITQSHIVVIILSDVDEGELTGVAGTDIIQFRQSGQELVGQVVGKATIQVKGERVYHVVHTIHRVGKRHRILRHTGARHAGTTIH